MALLWSNTVCVHVMWECLLWESTKLEWYGQWRFSARIWLLKYFWNTYYGTLPCYILGVCGKAGEGTRAIIFWVGPLCLWNTQPLAAGIRILNGTGIGEPWQCYMTHQSHARGHLRSNNLCSSKDSPPIWLTALMSWNSQKHSDFWSNCSQQNVWKQLLINGN